MNALLVQLSLLSALALTATAISLFALHRAHVLVREMDRRRGEGGASAEPSGEVRDLRDAVEALAAHVHEARQSPAALPEPGMPRAGLNLSKRSQALRMHRRGDGVEQIASALEVPRQEVDLLLKVHRIVLSRVSE
jgi:hypothetical protein